MELTTFESQALKRTLFTAVLEIIAHIDLSLLINSLRCSSVVDSLKTLLAITEFSEFGVLIINAISLTTIHINPRNV